MSSETPEEILLPATNGETVDEPEAAEAEDPMSGDVDGNEKDIFAEVNEEGVEKIETPIEETNEVQTAPVVPKKRKTSIAASPSPPVTPSPAENNIEKTEGSDEIGVVKETAKTEEIEEGDEEEDKEGGEEEDKEGVEEEDKEGDEDEGDEEGEEGETTATGPSTSRAATADKENEVDENQCRVCTATENLVSLFKTTEQRKTIAELIMLLCPNVSIAQKDFMPQFVCYPCFGKIQLAIQLKEQCEKTESELRKKLSRHKNKVRRPAGYVVVDAPLDSGSESEEEPNDDVEFKVSEASAEEEDDDDSESSDSESSDSRKRPSRGGRGVRRKSATTPSFRTKKNIKREADSNAGGGGGKAKRTKRYSESDEKPTEFPCDQCDHVFSRKVSLVLHKRTHSTEKTSYWCDLCGKQFKIQGAYRSHMEKHKNETSGYACEKCDEIYVSNADLKRHLAEDHDEQGLVYKCPKCKRTFVSQSRLSKHTSRCPGMPKKKSEFDGYTVGQDLFKTVAPLTSTYWSDSFSD